MHGGLIMHKLIAVSEVLIRCTSEKLVFETSSSSLTPYLLDILMKTVLTRERCDSVGWALCLFDESIAISSIRFL